MHCHAISIGLPLNCHKDSIFLRQTWLLFQPRSYLKKREWPPLGSSFETQIHSIVNAFQLFGSHPCQTPLTNPIRAFPAALITVYMEIIKQSKPRRQIKNEGNGLFRLIQVKPAKFFNISQRPLLQEREEGRMWLECEENRFCCWLSSFMRRDSKKFGRKQTKWFQVFL